MARSAHRGGSPREGAPLKRGRLRSELASGAATGGGGPARHPPPLQGRNTQAARGPPAGQVGTIQVREIYYRDRMGKLDFAFWDVIPHAANGTGIADEFDAHIRLA